MNSRILTTSASFLLVALVSHGAITPGDTILVDLTKSGQETSGNWNNIDDDDWANERGNLDSTLSSDLIRFSDGAATGVGLLWDNVSEVFAGDTVQSVSSIAGLDVTADGSASFPVSGAIPVSAQRDSSFHIADVNQYIFTGLDDALTYNLSFQSWTATTNRAAKDWILNPGASQVILSVDPNDAPSVYTFSSISTDGSGRIILRATNVENINNQHVNAIELTAVPEPSAFALMAGFLVLGLVVLKRRRS